MTEKTPLKIREYHYWIFFFMAVVLFIYLAFARITKPMFLHGYLHYNLFMFVQWIAMFNSWYSMKESNRWKFSIKAIDIYTHFYGSFCLFLIFYVLNTLYHELTLIFMVITIAIGYELWEIMVEAIDKLRIKRRKKKRKFIIKGKTKRMKHDEYIAEPIGNVVRDIFMDIIGVIVAYFYVMLL